MNWSEVPLRALYRRVEESGRPDLPLLSVYRDHGVIPRMGRVDNYNKPSADLSGYKVVQRGDLVINKMKTWQGSLGISDFEGIVSPAYFVGHPIGDVNDRFMHHLLRSRRLIAEYGARSKGIRPSQWDLPWDDFVSIKVRLPPLEEQQTIADYLDLEIACIDSLISKKRRMLELIDSRWVAEVVKMTTGDGQGWNELRLRRVVESIIGGAWGNEPGEGEVEAICIRGADFDMADLGVEKSKVPIRGFTRKEFLDREMRAGDLLIEKSGGGDLQPVGRVVRWCGGESAVPTNFAARLRPGENMDSQYLAFVFRAAYETGRTRAWVKQTTGIQNLDLRGFLSEKWPIPPLATQRSIAKQLGDATIRRQQLKSRLGRQIELLIERRQALITAAVTGELEIPGVLA